MASPTEDDLRVATKVTPQFRYEPDERYAKRVRRVASALAAEREKAAKRGLEAVLAIENSECADSYSPMQKAAQVAAAIRAGDKESK